MEWLFDFLLNNKDVLSSLSSVAVIVSTLFVAVQVRLLFNDYKKRNKKEEFSKSFELTKFYTSKILPKMPKIQMLYDLCGLMDKVQRIKPSIKNFDKEECIQFVDPSQFKDELKKIYNEPIEIIILLHAEFTGISMCAAFSEYDRYEKLVSENKNKEVLLEQYKKRICEFILDELNVAANDLEYFSMFFNSNLAESEVVYESLHQTFLAYVRLLFPIICYSNTRSDYSKKYYTHIRDLYVLWASKEVKKEVEQEAILDKLRNKNPKI